MPHSTCTIKHVEHACVGLDLLSYVALPPQAHISMRAAVLSPDSIMKLMRANLQDPQANLIASSADVEGLEQHWQQVTVSLFSCIIACCLLDCIAFC